MTIFNIVGQDFFKPLTSYLKNLYFDCLEIIYNSYSSELSYGIDREILVSTLADYEKFTDMLLSGGKTQNGCRILSEESIKLMATAAEPFDLARGEKWGLGVRVITENNNRIPKGSFGWSGAYGCHFWVDPTNNITAIYMKNSTYDGGSGAKTARNFETDVYS
jgi:CubicO group peptidase (beta-lactamase class C family)